MEVKEIYPKDIHYLIEFSRSDIEKISLACNRMIVKYDFDGKTEIDDACRFFINIFHPTLKDLLKNGS
jgi:hypothetical protein